MPDPGQELKDEMAQKISKSKVFSTLVEYLCKIFKVRLRVEKLIGKIKSVL